MKFNVLENLRPAPETSAVAVTSALVQASAGQRLGSETAGKLFISQEGLNEATVGEVQTATQRLRLAIDSAVKSAKFGTLNVSQEAAAVTAGLFASAPRDFLAQRGSDSATVAQLARSQNMEFIGHESIPGASDSRQVSLEAYDNRINVNTVSYSVSYNMQAARQEPCTELFYPTIVLSDQSIGFNVATRLLVTYAANQRAASGALNNFGRKNIIRAIVDHTILAADHTRLYPVHRNSGGNDSSAYFATGITPTTIVVDGQNITTAPLKIGASFSLLGISQTDAQLAQGLADETDAIDPAIALEAIYISLTEGGTTEYFRLVTGDLPTSDFNQAPQGDVRQMNLNFSSSDLALTGTTTTVAGTPSTILADAAIGTNIIRLKASLFGSVHTQLGDTNVMAAPLTIAKIANASGQDVSLTGSSGQAVATALGTMTVVGYDLKAYKTNSNRATKGNILDSQTLNYLYTVPYLPPLMAQRPVMESDANDGQLVADLVTATRFQCSNSAITAMKRTRDLLQAYASQPDVVRTQPKLFGAAAHLVNPVFLTDSIDCAADLQSVTESGKIADLSAMLVNKIRDLAARAFVSSNYGPASNAYFDGQAPKTTVLVLTDPTIHRYLTINGDTRLVGDQFEYRIEPCFDARVQGKIWFSFGHAEALTSGAIDPLHFGNMAWRPEMTVLLPMTRNNRQSQELTVTPSYRHVTHLPIFMELVVTNIDAVLGAKVELLVHNTGN